MRSVWIAADVTFYALPTEGSACKVTELHDARASPRFCVFSFSTNVDYGYVHVNWMVCFFITIRSLDFVYDVFDSIKKRSDSIMFANVKRILNYGWGF